MGGFVSKDSRSLLAFILVLIIVISAATAASAQSPATATATLSGIIVDETGAPVPGVDIVVLNIETSQNRQAVTNADGAFELPLLSPGRYRLTARMDGFAPLDVPEVVLKPHDKVALRLELKVASLGETVIVSAQKRDERRLDVPVPVAAVDGQKLAQDNHLGLREYFSSIPGLSMTTDSQGRQELAIRGVSAGRASIPTVGVLVDDVPFGYSLAGFASNPDVDPGDIARIEVLRGPQGSLYGTSSMGGLLKYVTVDPSFGGNSGRVEFGTSGVHNGDHPGYNLRMSANLKASDTWAFRVSGFTREDPGFVDNPFTGKKGVNNVDVHGGQIKALWKPSSQLSLTLNGIYQHTQADGLPEVDVVPGLTDLQQNTTIPSAGRYHRTIAAYSATLKATVGSVSLTSITGFNTNSFSDSVDFSALYHAYSQEFFNVGGVQFFDNITYRKFAQEIRASVPIGQHFEAMAGGFFTHERSGTGQLINAVDPTTGALAGALAIEPTYFETYDEPAVFGNLTWRPTKRFDIQVGGRESHYRVGDLPYATSGPLLGDFYQGALGSHGNVFTYLVTPRFKLSPDLMVYGRLASGYRPGGPNNPPGNQLAASFASDTTQNYEAGLKGDFAKHRLSVDASLFYINWSDIQLQVNDPVGGYKTNGSGAKSDGLELSILSKPLSGLTVDGWFVYDNAVLTQPFPVNSPLIGRPGDRLPYSSRHSSNLSVQQAFPLPGGAAWFFGGSVAYVGERISNFRAPGPIARQVFPAYTRTDLRAGLNRRSWTASLFLNNVGDVRGIVNISHYILYRTTYIQPRSVGVSISKEF